MSRVFAWFILSLAISILYSCTTGEAGTLKKQHPPGSDNIRLNQVGFYPSAPKRAVVLDSLGDSFLIRSVEDNSVVFDGKLSEAQYWEFSGERVRIADFSKVDKAGTYELELPNGEISHRFRIGQNIHQDLHKASLKSYYYQRSSLALDEKLAGPWARERGHPDLAVKIHPSAASPNRPAGTVIQAPKGWYDAGDYGKYTPNATYSTWILLHLYEQFPRQLHTLSYELPEAQNKIPDLLDESLWSIRWLLAMQDPESGMVYHKLTGLSHPKKVMPEEDKDDRYIIGTSTSTSLGYAAMMAKAARIYKEFPDALPGLADSCLHASLSAWKWSLSSPASYYKNPTGVHTGQSKDGDFSDEKAWAAAELYISTQADSFLNYHPTLLAKWKKPPGRSGPGVLGWMSINLHADIYKDKAFTQNIRKKFVDLVDLFLKQSQNSPYQVPLGRNKYDFLWGSNAIGASTGMCLVDAFILTGEKAYLDAGTDMLDYLLGRNATGYCFVTGMGSKSPVNIHHRPSASDGIQQPIPGLMVGGPQGEKNFDGCEYPSTFPAAFYSDVWCSYSTNEVSITWNAPLVYLSGALDFLNK